MTSGATQPSIAVIIPALDEEEAVGLVVGDIPRPPVEEVVVVDNGSRDATAEVAAAAGATVLREERRGYGWACLRAIGYLAAKPAHQRPDVVVFLDADYADRPEEIPRLVSPIVEEGCDLVLGSRLAGTMEEGAMLPQAVWGNRLATALIRLLYGTRFTDLGPFRAIRLERLLALEMEETTYGWTVEMQLKAVAAGLRVKEVPVGYRRRIGRSKVSGTVCGTLGAGYKIIGTILKHRLKTALRGA